MFKALYKSYANIMAKSFPFSIPNVIANAKTMQLPNTQLGAGRPQSDHLHVVGREGPSAPSKASWAAAAQEGRFRNLVRAKGRFQSANVTAQTAVRWMQPQNQKSADTRISS